MSPHSSHAKPDVELAGLRARIAELEKLDAARRRTEESLRLFQSIVEASHEALAIRTPAGRLVYVNPAFEQLFGRSLEAARQLDYRVCYPPESVEVLERVVAPVLARGASWEGELEAVTAAGRRFLMWERDDTVRGPDGCVQYAFGLMHDVSGRREAELRRQTLEAQLLQAQKMQAIGQLAGGIAHDFNNLLAAISGYTSLARGTLPAEHEAVKSLEQVIVAAEQAAGVTRALMTFSRKLPAEKRPTDLRVVAERSVQLLRRLLPATIRLDTRIDDRRPLTVNGDGTQLQQVIMNLAINARDAMPEGGVLAITADLEAPRRGTRMVRLVVRDTGVGLSAAQQQRIFEPFFTTKSEGKGTGLGLAIVLGIVQDHNGQISVDSRPGRGATFTVSLPHFPVPLPTEAAGATLAAPRGGGETILLAEDDEHVRRILASALLVLGYEVLQAADGQTLLETYRREGGRVRLVLTDLEMPERDGLACIQEIRQSGGGPIPAIVITARMDVDLEGRVDEHTAVLQKPFQLATLGTLVARLLRHRTEAGT